ncbi:MAG: TM2 domain-containing protein [Bacteroidaceae bacterium]|nr:TM2 domain-containing protein [Bacteroidaceae bacterium]
MFCKHCGSEVNDNAVVCVKCGCSLKDDQRDPFNPQKRDWLVVLLLCLFLGSLGVHRFYVGKTGTGIAMLLTCGGCGIWTLIDFIMILVGTFTDAEGRPITND